MRPGALVYVLAVLETGACAAGTHDVRGGRIAHVYVSVDAWDDARVGAYLTNRAGERTGWYKGRPIREIRGCIHEYGSEEGLPEGVDNDDSTSEVMPDREYTIPEEIGVTPKYHHFTVEDSADAPSLLRQGGCELRLVPVVSGKVHLILIAGGVGFRECKDTTSVWVKPGVPSRWRLSWRATADGCSVKVSRLAKGAARSR